jgi:hypothetical protein
MAYCFTVKFCFRKLLTSSATHRWQAEIQEGIYNMLELYIDLVITRLQHDPVPISLLNILATVRFRKCYFIVYFCVIFLQCF